MSPVSLLHILLLAPLMSNAVAGQKALPRHPARRPFNPEPFRSFAILDLKLSLLTAQQARLEASLNASSAAVSPSNSSPAQLRLLKNMDATTTVIIGRVNRLATLYAKRQQKFGVRTFKLMRVKARAVRHELIATRRARTDPARRTTERRLGERIIALVVQFQAVSGGHEATHCHAREWICCAPKRATDLMPGQEVGCSWMCIPTANKCRGLLGPRIPIVPATTAK
jgi:hypothetical protein